MFHYKTFLKHAFLGLFSLGLFFLSALCSISIARAELATGCVGDLPVPAQALIETRGAVNFDSPAGRVIQFTFQIALDEPQITAFYKDRLAQLGWQKQGNSYHRGAEQMRIVKSPKQAIEGRHSYDVTLAPLNSEAFQ